MKFLKLVFSQKKVFNDFIYFKLIISKIIKVAEYCLIQFLFLIEVDFFFQRTDQFDKKINLFF